MSGGSQVLFRTFISQKQPRRRERSSESRVWVRVPFRTAVRQPRTAPSTGNSFFMWSLGTSSVSICSPVRRWLSASFPYRRVTWQASGFRERLQRSRKGEQPFSWVLQAENLHRYQEALHNLKSAVKSRKWF